MFSVFAKRCNLHVKSKRCSPVAHTATPRDAEITNHIDHGLNFFSGYKVLSLLETPSSDAGSIDQADVYIHITFIKKWDICAGAALLNALGNVTTTVFQSIGVCSVLSRISC